MLLNRKEMLARLEKGEDALELSIEKWQDIVDGKGEDLLSQNCALCEIDGMQTDKNPDLDECRSCIIFKKTGKSNCLGTPYYDIKDEKERALKELEFLKSLRKK